MMLMLNSKSAHEKKDQPKILEISLNTINYVTDYSAYAEYRVLKYKEIEGKSPEV